MHLKELLNKNLIFISGKGGVGKTSISVLLALLASKQKKKTLIVEMNSMGRIAPVFKCDAMGHEEVALAPYLSGANLVPKRCFEEYVLKQVRFKKIYDVFFDNKYVTNFIRAVPGLNELLMLGKIYELEKACKNRMMGKKEYDIIIVDAPATGHGLSALEVPEVVLSAVKIGPLHRHAQNILDLLANKEKTAFSLVTLAEEMPVCESVEYLRAIRERTRVQVGPLFVNAVMSKPLSCKKYNVLKDELEMFSEYHTLAKERYALNQFYLNEIDRLFSDVSKIVVPYQFHGLDDKKDFVPLVKHIEESVLV